MTSPHVPTEDGIVVASPAAVQAASSQRQADRLKALGVDLSKYPSIENRQTYREIVSRTNRSMALPLMKAYAHDLLRKTPNPAMLTHIVTTRCNYLCSFCSFADTLNAPTQDLSLDEIERAYTSIGHSLHVIVYSGGEPTLNKDLPEIIETAYRLTPVKSIYIISNAWRPELIFQITHRAMQRCPGLHLTWSLSIEGPREFNNAERRTKAAQWDAWQHTVDAMEGLKRIRQRYGYHELNMQLCTVCSPANHRAMPEWYAMVRDTLQPDKWNLNLMRKSVQMGTHALPSFLERRARNMLDPFEETYLHITETVRQDVLAGRLKFLYHTRNPVDGALQSAVDLISQEENRRTVMEAKSQFRCRAGSMGAYISSEGEVSGCEEFAHHPVQNKSFGNLRDVDYDFQTLWRSKRADAIRERVGQSRECQGCTLESQRNYPAILASPLNLLKAGLLASRIR